MHLKRKSLLLLTFLLLLAYSCYDELSLPANSNRDDGEFNFSEAQKYFEKNVTDLKYYF